MKKFAVVILVAAMVFSASFGFADDVKVDVSNDNSATATGGNANQDQNQKQNQKQKQKQQQLQYTTGVEGNQMVTTPLQAPLLSAFVNAPMSDTPQGWKQIVCDSAYAEFTIGELRNMAKGGDFIDKRGNFWHALLTRDVKSSIRVFNQKTFNENTVVKVINLIPKRGAKVLGTAEGVGRYGWPVEEILAKSVLEVVEQTGSTSVVVYWDYFTERISMADSAGIGIAGSHTDGSTYAGSVGISTSKAYTLTSVAYRIKAMAYGDVGDQADICTVAVAFEPEPKPICDVTEIWERIRELEQMIIDCKFWSMDNLRNRAIVSYLYEKLYICEGKRTTSLLLKAIKHSELAQTNYDEVHHPTIPRIVSRKDWNEDRALGFLSLVYWNQAAAIRVTSGRGKEIDHASKKGLERMPTAIEEIKEIK